MTNGPTGPEQSTGTVSRIETASLIAAIQSALEDNEQLLGFTRGRLAGGWAGKLNLGPEAFLSPDVNVALTERRLFLQHFRPDTERPSDYPPHTLRLGEIVSVRYADVEAYTGTPMSRLVVSLSAERRIRIRCEGADRCAEAYALSRVFHALMPPTTPRDETPSARACPRCGEELEALSKFCPYCGASLAAPLPAEEAAHATDTL